MSDFLLEMSKNPQVRKIIKSTGLPVPMPPELARASGPYEAKFLQGKSVLLSSRADARLSSRLLKVLDASGADILLPESAHLSTLAHDLAIATELLPEESTQPLHAIIFDATRFEKTAQLDALHTFFGPVMRQLARNGRIIVLGPAYEDAASSSQAAVVGALEGFMRSVAKEIGKKGSTAMLLRVQKGAEDRVEGALRFFLSAHAAYIDGQPLTLTARVQSGETPGFVQPLAGKIALVTGAARGIGKATARRLAAEGAHVVALDLPHDESALASVAGEVGGDSLPLDLTAPDAARRIASFLTSRHGGVDIVVHNAGVTRDKTLARMKPEQWALTLDVNLRAIEAITAHLLEQEVLREDARIICLASVAGIAGNMGQTNYAASKSGVISYVKYMAEELAPKGITINAIAPGFIETRMTAAIPVAVREVGRRLNNLSQGGQPVDVAEAITFLATPGASSITGQVLRVCGGMMLGA